MGEVAERVVPLALGLLIVAAGGYLYTSEQRATANAEAVEATVVSSEVVNYQPRDDPGEVDDDDYRASVEYRYTYEGATYTSSDLCPGQGSGCAPAGDDRSEAEEFVERYPEGATVTAHLQPDEPSNAFLVEGGSSLTYLGLAGAGVVVALLGVRNLFIGSDVAAV